MSFFISGLRSVYTSVKNKMDTSHKTYRHKVISFINPGYWKTAC